MAKYGQHGAEWFGDQFINDLSRTSGVASSLEQCMKALASGEEVGIKASDSSMAPWIVPGDIMVFSTSNMEHVKAGDIVLYRSGGSAHARRVVRKTFLGHDIVLIIKADAQRKLDTPIKPPQISAVLKAVERKGRSIPARRLNRGILDWLTDYGTVSPLRKILGILFFFLPRSMRPGHAKHKHREA